MGLIVTSLLVGLVEFGVASAGPARASTAADPPVTDANPAKPGCVTQLEGAYGARIVAELRSVGDRDEQVSAPVILENVESAEAARMALAAAFDGPSTPGSFRYQAT